MMKIFKLISAIALSIVLFGSMAAGVMASSYGQTETCTGAYGQTVPCGSVKGASDSGVVYLADTALDTSTMLFASAIIVSGVGAFLLKKKLA